MFFSNVDYNSRMRHFSALSWLCKSLPWSSLTLKKQQWHYTNGLGGRGLKPETPGFLPGDWANHVNFPGCSFHSFKMDIMTWNGPWATWPHRVAVKSKCYKKGTALCNVWACGSCKCHQQHVADSYLHVPWGGATEFVTHQSVFTEHLWEPRRSGSPFSLPVAEPHWVPMGPYDRPRSNLLTFLFAAS